jgi:general secretion pathway protein G
VSQHYLRSLPVDPITESSSTWTTVAPDDPAKGGVQDIRSGANGRAPDGKLYRDL